MASAPPLHRHQLQPADDEGMPTYLEASSRDNRRLYAALGFTPVGEPVRLPDGGPVFAPMMRLPIPPRHARP